MEPMKSSVQVVMLSYPAFFFTLKESVLFSMFWNTKELFCFFGNWGRRAMVADIAIKNGVADVTKSSCTPLQPLWSYRLLWYTALCTTLWHHVLCWTALKSVGLRTKVIKLLLYSQAIFRGLHVSYPSYLLNA